MCNMKILVSILGILTAISVNAAELINATSTKLENIGVLGELNYRLVAKLKDEKSSYPKNKQSLSMLEVSLDGKNLIIPEAQYKDLNNVYLENIRVSYVKSQVSGSFIEVTIPFGNYEVCTNHEKETNIVQKQKIITFNMSGGMVKNRVKNVCTH